MSPDFFLIDFRKIHGHISSQEFTKGMVYPGGIGKVLDPRYKVAYMRDAHWPSMWVDTAEDLVRETFETYYAPERDLVNEDMLPNPSQQTTSQPKNRFDRFKNYAAGSLLTASSSVDELTR
ncbi:hypothetical protein AGABI1DRAFT_95892, partial [Agaricus bisporus var. burnettii JB137-S8]